MSVTTIHSHADTDLSVIHKPEDPMALYFDVTYFRHQKFEINRTSKEVRIPFSSEPSEKSCIIYLKWDGSWLIDEPLNDEFHDASYIDDGFRVAWFNMPAGFLGSLADLELFVVKGASL